MTHVFDITEYGACPDGSTMNTAAIQSAFDACHEAGGGTVVCGPGEFLTGSLELRSSVELHLEGGCRLVGSSEVADYEDFTAEGFRTENSPEGNSKSLIRQDTLSICTASSSPSRACTNTSVFSSTASGPIESPPNPQATAPVQASTSRTNDIPFAVNMRLNPT